ncbi:TetR family transcriptional regulator, partial [Mycobacterium marinum]|uniref:TetR family transcriptional regulator n=1 Tax=Mycobacterium marinum TaxID=1781 RepID=UPI0030B93712
MLFSSWDQRSSSRHSAARPQMPRYIDVDGLFDITVTVFAECGYRATTTQEIARRAG